VPKYVGDFDQMMKCDMCTDRSPKGSPDVRIGVPERGLWYGTVEEFDATREARSFGISSSAGRRAHEGLHGDRRRARRSGRRAVGGRSSWLDDPFGLEQSEVMP
jgi:hypothetical protein